MKEIGILVGVGIGAVLIIAGAFAIVVNASVYCSSPMSPGWNVSLPGGGCDNYNTEYGLITPFYIESGDYVMSPGIIFEFCPSWYPSGCVIR